MSDLDHISDDVRNLIDRRIEESEQLFIRNFPDTNEFLTIILKGHLLTEVHLTAILSHYFCDSKFLQDLRLSFSQKILLTKGIVKYEFPSEFWEFVRVLNSLRNDFSHQLEPEKQKEDWETIRKLSKPMMLQLAHPFKHLPFSDQDRLKALISSWIGFLQRVDGEIYIDKRPLNSA